MGLIDRLKNAVAGSNTSNPLDTSDINRSDAERIIEYAIDAGIKLDYDTAMKICALNNGVTLIAETIASLPLNLYQEQEGTTRKQIKDKRHNLINLENSVLTTSFNMKKKLIIDYIMRGNGYLDINKSIDGEITSLLNIDESEIVIETNNAINRRDLRIQYDFWGMKRDYHQVFNLVRNPTVEQYEGVGILTEGAELLGTARGLEEFSFNTVTNGFYAKGVIESDKVVSEPTRKSLRDRLKNFFSGARNSGKVLILDDGMKFKSLSLTPVDIELLKQKEFTINDIARLLNMPPAMIGGTGNSMTYTNVQDTQLQFLQTTIEPYLTIIENTCSKYLLTEKEKSEGFYYEFDTMSMLRMTPSRQVEMLSRAVGGKQFLTVDEARNQLNYKPVKGGDAIDFMPMKGGEKKNEEN